MSKVRDVRVQPQWDVGQSDALIVTWNAIVLDEPLVTLFRVYRSLDGVIGNYVLLGETVLTQFKDAQISQTRPSYDPLYKVTYVTGTGESEVESSLSDATPSGVLTLFADKHGTARHTVHHALLQSVAQANFVITTFGEDVVLFLKKVVGEKCPKCYDTVDGTSENPRCEICFGTGIVGGYEIFYTRAFVDSAQEKLDAGEHAVAVVKNPIMTVSNFPYVHEGDYVRRADGKIFIVGSVNAIVIATYLAQQQFQMGQVPATSILYKKLVTTSTEHSVISPT